MGKRDLPRHALHDIGVEWHPCDVPNCPYQTKRPGNIKQHKRDVHNIDVRWYRCDMCPYKAKQSSHLKIHRRDVHKAIQQDYNPKPRIKHGEARRKAEAEAAAKEAALKAAAAEALLGTCLIAPPLSPQLPTAANHETKLENP